MSSVHCGYAEGAASELELSSIELCDKVVSYTKRFGNVSKLTCYVLTGQLKNACRFSVHILPRGSFIIFFNPKKRLSEQ